MGLSVRACACACACVCVCVCVSGEEKDWSSEWVSRVRTEAAGRYFKKLEFRLTANVESEFLVSDTRLRQTSAQLSCCDFNAKRSERNRSERKGRAKGDDMVQSKTVWSSLWACTGR